MTFGRHKLACEYNIKIYVSGKALEGVWEMNYD
jgi:hypothetical protein